MTAPAGWRRWLVSPPEFRSSAPADGCPPSRGRAPSFGGFGPRALAGLLSAVLLAGPALAANECGNPPTNGGTITCDQNDQSSAGSGITYSFGSSNTNNYTIDVSGTLTVSTSAASATGLFASQAGDGSNLTINMSGATLTTQGGLANGLYAYKNSDGDLALTLSGGTVNTHGGFSDGVYGYKTGTGGAALTMSGGTINTRGGGSPGFRGNYNSGAGTLSVTMSGGTIKTGTGSADDTGDSSHGLVGQTGSASTGALTISMTGGTIQTGFGSGADAGEEADGIFGDHDGSGTFSITLSGGSIHTKGEHDSDSSTRNGANGIYSLNDGNGSQTSIVSMSGGSIDTEGESADAIHASAYLGSGVDIDLTSAIPAGTCTSSTTTGCDLHTRGASAHGIYGYTRNRVSGTPPVTTPPSGSVDIDMAGGDLLTEGSGAYGIYGRTPGSGNIAIDLSGGDILTEGQTAYGIRGRHTGGGNLAIAMSGGTITTGSGSETDAGQNASGIFADRRGSGSGTSSVTLSGGSVTTGSGSGTGAGDNAAGIESFNNGNSASVVAMSGGSIDTHGSDAPGIYGWAHGAGNVDIDLTNAIPAGTCTSGTTTGCDIHTRGSTSYGIYGYAKANSGTSPSGTIDIDMAGGNILTEGTTADGIYANNEGTGASSVTLSGGSIHTKGTSAAGIESFNAGTEDADGNASTSTVTLSGGSIDTEGGPDTNRNGAYGIHGLAHGAGNVDIDLTNAIPAGTCTSGTTTGCDIHTKRDRAHGVYGLAEADSSNNAPTGTVAIGMASGDILTEGELASGVFGKHEGSGSLAVTLSGGGIDTDADSAYGLRGHHEGSAGLTLTMSGGSIHTGKVTDNGDGTVTVTGDRSYGIHGRHEGDALAASTLAIAISGGDIVTEGIGATGILGWHSGSGKIDIDMTFAGSRTGNCNGDTGAGCEIRTKGDDSHGIYGLHDHLGVGVASAGETDIDVSGGDILTEGEDSHGIYAWQQDSNAALAIDMTGGSVRTKETRSYGIYGKHSTAASSASDTVVDIELSGGVIVTEGSYATGILGGSDNDSDNTVGSVLIELTGSGSIETQGDYSEGIVGNHTGSGGLEINLKDDGSVLTKGMAAHGVHASHAGASTSRISIAVSGGSIATTGSNANPIHFAATNAARTLTLRGATLSAPTGGTEIIFGGSGDDALTVLGQGGAGMTAATTIRGNVAMGGGSDRLLLDACLQADADDPGDTDCTAARGGLVLSHSGMISGAENIDKIGSGTARLATGLDADGAMMTLKDGDLHLEGNLDLGETGELTIRDATRLIFGRDADGNHAYVTASKVTFASDSYQKLFLAGEMTLPAGSDLLRDPGTTTAKLYKSDGTTEVDALKLYDLAGGELAGVSSEGEVLAAASTEHLECGAIPSAAPFTITCSAATYAVGRGDDPGIEYDFGASATDWTVHFPGGNLQVAATTGFPAPDAGEHGFHGHHSGTGDLTVSMSSFRGSLAASGSGGHALYAHHEGGGDLAIDLDMAGGRVLKAEGSGGHGLYGRHEGDGNLAITLSGRVSNIEAEGSGGHGLYGHHAGNGNLTIDLTGFPGNVYALSSEGHAIYGHHEGTAGTLDVSVSSVAWVRAKESEAIHLRSDSAPKALTLADRAYVFLLEDGNAIRFSGSAADTLVATGQVFVSGRVVMGSGDSTVTLAQAPWIGDIDFGAGEDKLVLSACLQSDVDDPTDTDCETLQGDFSGRYGTFANLETITKVGSGSVTLSAREFAGTNVVLKDGTLQLDGHLNLGDGELTIHDQTRLVFGARSATDHAYVTASKVTLADDEWQRVYLVGGVKLPSGTDLLRDPGMTTSKFYKSDGTTEADALKLYDLADGELASVSSEGELQAAVSTDDLECGAIPTAAPFTVTCSETTYDLGTRGDDPGIEYDFGSSGNDYAILFKDDPTNEDVDFLVQTQDAGDHGLEALHSGAGKLSIEMTSGSIITYGENAHGIRGEHAGSGSLEVSVSNGSVQSQRGDGISLTASSAKSVTLKDSTLRSYDWSNSAIWFSGSTADRLVVSGTTIRGGVSMSGGDDTLIIAGPGRTVLEDQGHRTDLYLGNGNDTVVFDACLQADVDDMSDADCTTVRGNLDLVTGSNRFHVETVNKIGSGEARLDGMHAHGATVVLKDGSLRLNGHLDLGAEGELTIQDQTRLIFGSDADGDHAYITAKKVTFYTDSYQKLFLYGGLTLPAGTDLLRDPGTETARFYKSDGNTQVDALKLYDIADGELAGVSSDGVVQAAVSTDDPECGAIPTSAPLTVTCDENTYSVSTRGDDPGIEYEFADSADDYTINVRDDDNDPDTLAVSTTAGRDPGLWAVRQSGAGDLEIGMSGGSISTAGILSHGIHGSRRGAGDLAIGMSGGSISTAGAVAHGILGLSRDEAALEIELSGGSIATTGSSSIGVYGYAQARTGDHDDDPDTPDERIQPTGDIAITMSSGRIVTEGDYVRGIIAYHEGNANIAIRLTDAIPAGTCDGTDSTGCDLLSSGPGIHGYHRGTGTLAFTMAGGDVRAAGHGIDLFHQGTRGDVKVGLSGGTVATTVDYARGIWAGNIASTEGEVEIELSGGAVSTEGRNAHGISGEQIHSGSNLAIRLTDAIPAGTCDGTDSTGCDIRTKGSAASGIHAGQGGTGTLTVDMAGGDILTEGDAAHGIYADHGGTGALSIDVSGGAVGTAGLDAHGIRVTDGDDVTVRITGGRISVAGDGAVHVHFGNATTSRDLTLRGAQFIKPADSQGSYGVSVLYDGTDDDTLTVLGSDTPGTATTTVRGDINLFDGDDTVVFSTCRAADVSAGGACAGQMASGGDIRLDHAGAFTGLEEISKIGSGTLWLSDMASRGSAMETKDGDLRLSGHLDLGSGGVLTVHDTSRLVFGATAGGHGRITASQVRINDADLRLYADATDTLATANDVLLGGGRFHDGAGEEATPKLLNLANGAEISTFTSDGCLLASDGSGCPDTPPPPVAPGPGPGPAPDPGPGLTPVVGCDPAAGSLVRCRTAGIDVLFLTVDEKNELDFDLGWYPETNAFHKLGQGWARFGDTALPGGRVSLDEGGLLLEGHLDLGVEGTLYVVELSRLTFGTPDEGPGHGRITAGRVVFVGPWTEGERVYATGEAADRLDGEQVLNAGLFVSGMTDSVVRPALYEESGWRQIGRLTPDGRVTLDTGDRPSDPAPLPLPGDCPEGHACIDDPVDPVVPGRPVDPGDGAPSPCPPGEACTQPVDPGDGNESPSSGDDDGPSTQPQPEPPPEPQPQPQPPEGDPTVPNPCPPGGGVCGFEPVTGSVPEGPDTAPPQAPDTPSDRAVAEAGESGEPQAPATVGLASGSMMRLTAAALDRGAGPAGASAGRAGFATGTGAATSHGPWVRALAGGLSGLGNRVGGSVAGLAVGFDAELGRGLHLGTSVTPEARASSADGRSRLTGDVWTTRLGWNAGGAFADAALAYGRSRARSQSVDAVTGDILDGASGLVQSHAQATAGHRVSAGPLVAVPSVSLFAGSLEHGARTAHGAVLRTETPGFTQSYQGWKAGLALGTEDWLDGAGALRWRPHLRADYERTTDEGPETLMVHKADHAGVLSFESEERVAGGLPRETLRLDLGAELRGGSEAWGVGLGLSGAWTDGETDHGVQARFSLRF